MIWHETESVAVIVMLTPLMEGLREKCFQYFPEDANSESMAVNITDDRGEQYEGAVKLLDKSYDEVSSTTVRKLLLVCGKETKVIWHLLFLGWPDHGVPDPNQCDSLLELIKLSRAKNSRLDHPRIIHCSAGVGRTGTFIALEHLLDDLESGDWAEIDNDEDRIFDIVNTLREQRMTMVQSEIQYQFLYDLLRERYRTLIQAPSSVTHLSEGDLLATDKIPAAGGEPSPKVMRLSKGIKSAFLRATSRGQSRSRSRPREGDDTQVPSTEGKTPTIS